MKKYLVALFMLLALSACLQPQSGALGGLGSLAQSNPQTVSGVVYYLKGCTLSGNELTCNMTVTSQYQDKSFEIYTKKVNSIGITSIDGLSDNQGNTYTAVSKTIGNKINHDIFTFIANLATPVQFTFNNIATNATSVSMLSLAVHHGSNNWDQIDFRNIPIIK